MAAPKDYKAIKDAYVTSEKSYRELAKEFDASFSYLAEKGKREDWPGQRLAYKAAIARRAYDHAANAVADEQSTVQKESILVARAYLRKFGQQMLQPDFKTNAKDALEFIRLLANELSTPEGARSGPTIIDGVARPVADPDFLRRVVEMARERVAAPGSLGPGPLVESSRTRPN